MDYSIPGAVLEKSMPVFPYTIDNVTVWVKKRRSRENLLGWRLQRIFYRLTGVLLALPPDEPPADNVVFETGRLRQAADLGFRVPDILYQTGEYFVMASTGQMLEFFIKGGHAKAGLYVEQALRVLRALHDKGLAHGGAQIKNITVRDDEIFFIDFEENIPADGVRLFQLRDLFLFLLSLERSGAVFDLRHLCDVYGGDQSAEVLTWVVKSIRQLRALRFFKSRLFSRFSMGDIRGICRLLDKADKVHSGTL